MNRRRRSPHRPQTTHEELLAAGSWVVQILRNGVAAQNPELWTEAFAALARAVARCHAEDGTAPAASQYSGDKGQ